MNNEFNILKNIISDISNYGICHVVINDSTSMLLRSDKDGNIKYYVSEKNLNFRELNDNYNIKAVYCNIFIIYLFNLLGVKLSQIRMNNNNSNNEIQPEWIKAANLLSINFKNIINDLTDNITSISVNNTNSVIENVTNCVTNKNISTYVSTMHELPYLLDTIDMDTNKLYKKLAKVVTDKDTNITPKKEETTSSDKKDELDLTKLKESTIQYEFLDNKEYIVNPAIGREKEIRNLGAILLTPSYSAMLLGNSGVGKTAIVEGLCYAIKNKLVSEKLQDKKILKINIASIISGTKFVGELEQKMEKLIIFLKNNPNVILYIDEIHMIIGAGASSKSNTDVANILKPYIENGTIKVIGATTFSEYDKYLSFDQAFTRRFKQVKINEPEKEVLRNILESNIDKYEETTNIKFSLNEDLKDQMIEFLINITSSMHRSYLEQRSNPALALSIIEESFGYASYDFSEEVGIKYLKEAIINCENIYSSAKNKLIYLDNLNKTKSKSKIIDFKERRSK